MKDLAADGSQCGPLFPVRSADTRRVRRQVVSAVLPCVKDLAADGSQNVRTALAGVVMEMAPALGKAATIEHLLPVFLSLLKDDFPDVRLNIIAKLDQARRLCSLSTTNS